MTTYILKRIVQIIPTLIGITLITFVLVRLTGDPAAIMMDPWTPQAEREAFNREYGLDQPLYIQYLRFVGKAVQGDFGKSIRFRQSVLPLFLERLPATLQLGVSAIVLAILVAVPLGIIAAVKRGTWIDGSVRFISLIGQAVPSFYLGLMLIFLVAVRWRLLPTSGSGTLRHLVLPSITLATFFIALIARFTRGAVLDILRQDYVRTARAKGLAETTVLVRHVLKNAMIPVLTIIGLQVGGLAGGAVITETVFAWPGVGRLMVQAIMSRDFPIVQATVMIVAVVFVTVNLLVDLAYAWLDPRIKYH